MFLNANNNLTISIFPFSTARYNNGLKKQIILNLIKIVIFEYNNLIIWIRIPFKKKFIEIWFKLKILILLNLLFEIVFK